ncbi:MAG: hypothetical protein WDW38_002230 [Sanguina aurantia]
MAAPSINAYISHVQAAVNAKNGPALRSLLQMDSDAWMITTQASQRGTSLPQAGELLRRIGDAWGGIVASLLQALLLVHREDYTGACKEFRERHAKSIIDLVKTSKESWVLQPLIGMVLTLKSLSCQADGALKRKGLPSTQLSECAITLQAVFGSTAPTAARGDTEMKEATVAIACTMLKVYFRLNTINNCKHPISTIDDKLKLFDFAPAAYQTTFRYYTGRLAAYDEDFAKADAHLSFAYRLCHKDAKANQRRILKFLVPVKMLLGILPSDALLMSHGLTEYVDIKNAMKTGDVALLLRCLAANQTKLIQAGTFLLLEKLQLAVMRRLFRSCALVHAQTCAAGKAQQVPISLLQSALAQQGVHKDTQELMCLLANLIYRKYIKGYMAFKSQVVVLAKLDPFPNLASVTLSDPFALG